MIAFGRLWCLAAILLSLLGCAGSGDEAETTGSDGPEATQASVTVPGLALNDGERWVVDDHTRATFSKMAATFAVVETTSGESAAIRATGAALRDQIDELIQGCTMQGAAHDNLHRFLMAYIPAVESMKEHGSAAYADTVAGLLASYPTYFR